MGTFTGKCRYCGNEINIIAENQEDADRQASRDCSCCGMQREEAVHRRKAAMTNELAKLIGSGCEAEGFRPVKDRTAMTIAVLGEMVVDGEVQKATIAVDGTTITIAGGEKIKVKRTMKYEQGSQV